MFGFLGPNGAGKSTTMRLLLDLIRPTSGSAQILGLDTVGDSMAIRRRVGFLPGDLALYPKLTGRVVLDHLAALRGGVDVHLRDSLVERFDAELDRPVRELSTGNRQKLGLIQAFMHEPELLILDEPIAGLDPLVQQSFHALLGEVSAQGRTVFLSSHTLSEVERVTHRLAILRQGRLAVVDSLENLRRVAVQRLEIEFRRPVAAAGVPRPPRSHRGERRRAHAHGGIRGFGPRRREGRGSTRCPGSPPARGRPRGHLPALLPSGRSAMSRPVVRMALRLRLPSTVSAAVALIAVLLAVGALFPAVGHTIGKLNIPTGFAQLLGGADYGTITGWFRSEIGRDRRAAGDRRVGHQRAPPAITGRRGGGPDLGLVLAHPVSSLAPGGGQGGRRRRGCRADRPGSLGGAWSAGWPSAAAGSAWDTRSPSRSIWCSSGSPSGRGPGPRGRYWPPLAGHGDRRWGGDRRLVDDGLVPLVSGLGVARATCRSSTTTSATPAHPWRRRSRRGGAGRLQRAGHRPGDGGLRTSGSQSLRPERPGRGAENPHHR